LVLSSGSTIKSADNNKCDDNVPLLNSLITLRQIKNFGAGVIIGATHGLLNKLLKNRVQDKAIFYTITTLVAVSINGQRDVNVKNSLSDSASWWGHGMAQSWFEAFNWADGSLDKIEFNGALANAAIRTVFGPLLDILLLP